MRTVLKWLALAVTMLVGLVWSAVLSVLDVIVHKNGWSIIPAIALIEVIILFSGTFLLLLGFLIKFAPDMKTAAKLQNVIYFGVFCIVQVTKKIDARPEFKRAVKEKMSLPPEQFLAWLDSVT